MLSHKETAGWIAAFHCQQCAEKSLKAWLAHKQEAIPFVHDIRYLIQRCEETGTWARDIREAHVLTPFGTTTRYPGFLDRVEPDRAQEALRQAEMVYEAVKKALVSDGIKLQ
jgi:HEPN domain-containing protein